MGDGQGKGASGFWFSSLYFVGFVSFFFVLFSFLFSVLLIYLCVFSIYFLSACVVLVLSRFGGAFVVSFLICLLIPSCAYNANRRGETLLRNTCVDW